MSLSKRLLEDYCAAKHPQDYDAQEALFDRICSGIVRVPVEEMYALLNKFEDEPTNRE